MIVSLEGIWSEGEQFGSIISWMKDDSNFGNITIMSNKGVLTIDSETLSRDSVKKILSKLVDSAVFVGE